MRNFTLKTLFRSAVCAFTLISLASCSQAPESEPALPDMETRTKLTDMQDGPFRLEFFDLPSPVYPCQRITFRVYYNQLHSYGYDEHQLVKIRIYNPKTGEELAQNEKPGYGQYYFFTRSSSLYLIEATLISDPTVKATFPISVEPGVFLKLVPEDRWEYSVPEKDGTVFLQANAIHFYTDEACKTRIMSLLRPITVRVHLVKKAIELFSPNVSNLYRDEDVYTSEGRSESCSGRLIITQQTLPSGEYLEDYYEIEVLKVY